MQELEQELYKYYGSLNVKAIMELLWEFDSQMETSDFKEFLINKQGETK